MSAEHPYDVMVEPDRPPSRRLVQIGIVGLLVIVGSCLLVGWWLPPRRVLPTAFQGPAPAEIARVDQTLISQGYAAWRLAAQKEARLRQYEWVDKEKGVVRIPVERAMDLVVEEAGR